MTTALPVLVVRNTFLDVEEVEAAESGSSCRRSSSAPRSWKPESNGDSPLASTAASCACSDDEASDSACSSREAPRLDWAEADADSDEEFFSKMPKRWSSLQWCARPSKSTSALAENDVVHHQTGLFNPPMALLPPGFVTPAEQQGAQPVAPLTAAAPLRTKLSGAARSFNPLKTPSTVNMAPPIGVHAAPAAPESLPVPAALQAPPRMSAATLATLSSMGCKFGDLQMVDRAFRRASGPKASRNRQQRQLLLRRENRQFTSGVGAAVRSAISKTEGVASVAVSTDINETSFMVQVKSGNKLAVDAVLRDAKAAVMNASALSSMGSYVIGYLNRPFEEFPGGFRTSVGIVQQRDEASACWSFYENGSCPCRATCCKQHPKEQDLERIVVMVAP